MKRTVLIIEDDKNIAELVAIHLRDLDFEVAFANDGREGLLKARNEDFNLIILDIMLPGMDGFDVCKSIRADHMTVPILMLTSKSEEIDKVLGLEIGADDYLTKPFSIRELIARVKAILRRSEQSTEANEAHDDVRYGDLHINRSKRITEIKGNRIELSPKEFDLLYLLSSNPGSTYSREQLLNEVWGYEYAGYEHTVNSHINRLRQKIEIDMNEPKFILTTWGVGYRFAEEV